MLSAQQHAFTILEAHAKIHKLLRVQKISITRDWFTSQWLMIKCWAFKILLEKETQAPSSDSNCFQRKTALPVHQNKIISFPSSGYYLKQMKRQLFSLLAKDQNSMVKSHIWKLQTYQKSQNRKRRTHWPIWKTKTTKQKRSKNQLVRPLRDILLAFHHSSPRPVHFLGYREGELNRAVY